MSFNSNTPNANKLPGLPGFPQQPGKPAQNGQNGGPAPLKPLPSLPTTSKPAPAPVPSLPKAPNVPSPSVPGRFQPPTQAPAVVPTPAVKPAFTQPPAPAEEPSYSNAEVKFEAEPFVEVKDTPEEEPSRPKRSLGFSKKDTGNTKPTSAKTNDKKTPYSGRRRNVIYARVAVFGIVGILMIAGLFSFLPKGSALTESDKPLILSVVRENLNHTDFPRVAGEGFATAFVKTYLNFTPETSQERYEALKMYADETILTEIQPRAATEEEIAFAREAQAASPVAGTDDVGSLPVPVAGNASNVQTITDGPYIVGSLMYKGGNAALFTVMSEVNNSSWIYMQVPMYYDKTTGGLSVSGSVTFSPSIPTSVVPDWEKNSTWSETDSAIATSIKADIGSYLTAWADGDDTNLQRYIVKKDGKIVATQNALEGLNGKVVYVGMSNLVVEGKPALTEESTDEERASFNVRQANVTVNFLEPSSGLVYTQQFRLVLEFVNEDWFVQDINNISTQIDRDDAITKEQKKTSSGNE